MKSHRLKALVLLLSWVSVSVAQAQDNQPVGVVDNRAASTASTAPDASMAEEAVVDESGAEPIEADARSGEALEPDSNPSAEGEETSQNR